MTNDAHAPAVPEPPRVSPDGRFYLQGGQWVPFPVAGPDRGSVANGVADGILSVFGQLLLVTFVFPMVAAGVILLVLNVVPEDWAAVALVACVVVLVYGLWKVIRAFR